MQLAKNIILIISSKFVVCYLLTFFHCVFCFLFCCVAFIFVNILYIQLKKLAGGFNGIGYVSTSLVNMFGSKNLIVDIKLL
jgi:hypothetical protein